ncbi:MAG: hypothetical protein RLZZ187_2287 [Pseudomonadota bacterium]
MRAFFIGRPTDRAQTEVVCPPKEHVMPVTAARLGFLPLARPAEFCLLPAICAGRAQ